MFDTRNVGAYLRGLNFGELKIALKNMRHRGSTIQLLVRLDIYDKKGKLVKTTGNRKSHSFVIGFLKHLEISTGHTYNSTTPSGCVQKDVGGNNRTYSYNAHYMQYMWSSNALSNDDTYGIVVGTGTDTPASDDFNLQTKILDGIGSGQLEYGACVTNSAQVIGANCDMVVTRTFMNGSGAAITIREVGWILYTRWSSTAAYRFLVAHDLVNQEVPDGYIAVVSYTVRTTV